MAKMTDKERSLANAINEGFLDGMEAKPSKEYQNQEYNHIYYQKSDRIQNGKMVTSTQTTDTKAFDSHDSNYTSVSNSESEVGARAAARVMLEHPYRYQDILDKADSVIEEHPEFATAPVHRKQPSTKSVEKPKKAKVTSKKKSVKKTVVDQEMVDVASGSYEPPYNYENSAYQQAKEEDDTFITALADFTLAVIAEVGRKYYESHQDEIHAIAKSMLKKTKGKVVNTGHAVKQLATKLKRHQRK